MHVNFIACSSVLKQSLSHAATCWRACNILLLGHDADMQLCQKILPPSVDKSIFISAWLNGNDRNLKSNITEQDKKSKWHN